MTTALSDAWPWFDREPIRDLGGPEVTYEPKPMLVCQDAYTPQPVRSTASAGSMVRSTTLVPELSQA